MSTVDNFQGEEAEALVEDGALQLGRLPALGRELLEVTHPVGLS